MLGAFPQNVFAYRHVCRAKAACPQTLSKREPQNAPQTPPQTPPQIFGSARNTMHTHVSGLQACLRACLRAHLWTHLRTSAARTTCGRCVKGICGRELVAVCRSCFAKQTHTMEVLVGTASAVASSGKGNRTRYLQVTPTKAPATKPRAHAVSHGRTIGGGVWLRPFLVWHAM